MARKKGQDGAVPPAESGPPPDGGNRPAHDIRMGRLRCTLWRNEHPEQGVWFSMTFARSYKDKDGRWKSAHSFGRDDLLVLAELCRLAFLWIANRQGGAGIPDEAAGHPGTEPEAPA